METYFLSEFPVAEAEKKQYTTPTLIEHGNVQEITGLEDDDTIGGSGMTQIDPPSLQID